MPDPKPAGILVASDNLLTADLVATRLMEFDPYRLKRFTILDPKFDFGPRKLEEMEIRSDTEDLQGTHAHGTNRFFAFKPHPGGARYIEIQE